MSNSGHSETEQPSEVSVLPQSPSASSTAQHWTALSTLFAAWLVQFCTVGPVVSFGVYQAFYTSTWLPNVSPSTISWIGSIQLFLEFAMALLAGPLLDRGYLRHLLVSGSAVFTGSAFAMAFTSRGEFYQIFLCQGVGMGIGLGLVYMPSIVIMGQHFTNRPMLAMGIVSTGGSAGGLVFPIILESYFNGKNDFKAGVLTCAWIILGCLALSIIILLTFSGNNNSQNPRRAKETEHSYSTTDLEKDSSPPHAPEPTTMKHTINAFILAVIGSFFASTTCFWPTFYISLFGESHGVSSSHAAFAVSALNIASIVGRTVPCWIADRTGVFWVIVPSVFLAGISSLVMLACKNFASLVAFAVIYGILSGAYVALFFPMVNTLTARWPEKKGFLNGVACVPVSVALLIGNPVTGAIVGSGTSFKWAQGAGFCAACLLAGAAFLATAGYVSRLEEKQNHSVP